MRRWHKVVLVGICLASALVLARLTLADRFTPQSLLAVMRTGGQSLWAMPLFFGLFLAGATLLVPAVVFFAVAGVTWGFGPGALISWVTANLVTNLHFLAARKAGQQRVTEWLARNGMGRITQQVHGGGALAVLMIRQLPLPFVGVNLACGASPLLWKDFAIGNALGLLPNCLVYTWFAASIVNGAAGAERQAVLTGLGIGACVISLSLVMRFVSRRWLAKTQAEATPANDADA